ncbi:MAG: DUF2231 domain-containing protein [Candidatus Marinimicrobia bacterium]|nr:DUF2231 domain-containing protein [Candidatus Neomarinimicrobiota bacterium]
MPKILNDVKMYQLNNIHPLFIHFPIALFATGYLFDLIGILFNRPKFLIAGWYNLLIGIPSLLAAVLTGFLADTLYGHMMEPFPLYDTHGIIMIFAGLILISVTAIRFKTQPEFPGDKRTKIVLLLVHGLTLLIIFYGAHLGAILGERI